LNGVACGHRLRDRLEHRIKECLRRQLADARFGGDLLNQFLLVHSGYSWG
jgi:hypothetical protein